MVEFEVLNFSTTEADEDVNRREDELEELLQEYNEALKAPAFESSQIYKSILQSKFFKEKLEPIRDIHDSQIHTLQYCVFKNYAPISDNYLKYLKKAAEIDPSDIDLRLKICDLSSIEDAYEEVLKLLKLPLTDKEETRIKRKLALILYEYGMEAEAAEIYSKIGNDFANFIKQAKTVKTTSWDCAFNPIEVRVRGSTLSSVLIAILKEFSDHVRNGEGTMHIKINRIYEVQPVKMEFKLPENKDEKMDVVEKLDSPDSDQSGLLNKRERSEKRESMRVKKLKELDGEEPLEIRQMESLQELNEDLPDEFQFTEHSSTFPSGGLDTESLISNIQRIFLKKASSIKRKSTTLTIDYNLIEGKHPFFTDPNFGSELDFDGFIPTILKQILQILLANTENWEPSLTYTVSIIIQLLSSYSDYSPTSELILVCELLFDGMIDQSKTCKYEAQLELFGGRNENPLTQNTLLAILNRYLTRLSLQLPSGELGNNTDYLRYYWLKACYEEIFGSPLSTVNSLKDCADYLKRFGPQFSLKRPYCSNDPIITIETVEMKRKYQKLRLRIDETKYLYRENQHREVFVRLEPVLKISEREGSQNATNIINEMPFRKQLELLELLKSSSLKLVEPLTAFQASVGSIERLFKYIESGCEDLFWCLEQLCEHFLYIKNRIIEGPDWRTIFDTDSSWKHFCFLTFQTLQICWVFGSNLKDIPTIPKTTFKRNFEIMRSLCSRSLIVFYYILKELYYEGSYDVERANNVISETLIWIHEQLGIASLCAGDDGAFLKLIVQHVAKVDSYYHYEIYQCFSCLFGTDISVNSSQVLMDHHCAKASFDIDAAEIMYKFIQPAISEKIETRNFRTIPKDLKDCLDMILEIVQCPPNIPVLRTNTGNIRAFVSSDINVKQLDPSKPLYLELYADVFQRNQISEIFKQVYYFEGKLLLFNYYTKQDKESDFINKSIDRFIYHLSFNPSDVDSWISLGNAYAAKSYEQLGIGINDKLDSNRVCESQKAAYNCFLRATKLVSKLESAEYSRVKDYLPSLLYSDFALLLQTIVSAPMAGVTLQNSTSSSVLIWRQRFAELQNEISGGPPMFYNDSSKVAINQVYRGISFCLKKAILLDSTPWVYHFRLANTFRKLKKSAKEILGLYFKVLDMIPNEPVSKDYDIKLEVVYKCVAYLLKGYQKNELNKEEVIGFIENIVAKHDGLKSFKETHIFPSSDRIVERELLMILESIKKLDRKKWFHRPYFRIAWIYDHIFNDPETAKEEMISFLNARSKSGIRKIWKTELELPGRHFVYFHQYLKYLLDLSERTKDYQIIWTLCKRLRGEESLLVRSKLWLEARSALFANIRSLVTIPAGILEEFRNKVANINPDVEKKMQENYKQDEHCELHLLAIACDLKRNRKVHDQQLEDFIVQLYCKLYLLANTDEHRPCRVNKLIGKIVSRALVITRQAGFATKDEKIN